MTATEPRRATSRPEPASAPPSDDYPDAVRMALAAIAAAGVGFFLCHLAYGRLAALLLTLTAAALAGLSLLGLDRRAWLGWCGVGVNVLFVVILVAFPRQLELEGWWPVRAEPTPAATPGMSADGWVDAGEAAWEEDGVRVALTFATVGPDPAVGNRGRSEPYLWVGVRVTATGSRPILFAGWDVGSAEGPILTTAGGTRLAGRRVGTPGKVTLTANKPAECVLAFAVPPAGEAVRLELPAAAYGGTAPARFQIAPELIARK